MSADNKKQDLRLLLSGKSTEELEELLTLDFAEDKKVVDAEYISTILEVIEERENTEENEETQDAWKEFQAYCMQRESQQEAEADITEKLTHSDHQRKTEYCQKSRKRTSAWRVGVIAAVMTILLCGTAFGWNLFQVIAEWTEEVFFFITGQEHTEKEKSNIFVVLHNNVALRTDVPCVPKWAPSGTEEFGTLSVVSRDDRCMIGMGYITDERAFTIQITVYMTVHDSQPYTYQKDASICEEYIVNGITHYIVENNEHLSAMWVNESVEGYIQGNLTVEELRQMIDSIYEE